MRYFELCDKSVLFANEVMESPEFKELQEIKELISTTIVDLLEEFKKAKEKYEEVQKYGTYHPDYRKVKLELVKAKEALYTNSLVIRYKELEKIIQEKLNIAANEIAKAISINVK